METKAYWCFQLSCHMPQNSKNTKCPSRPSFKLNKRRLRAFWRFPPGLELSSCCSRLMSQGQPLPPKNSEFLKFIFPLVAYFNDLCAELVHFLELRPQAESCGKVTICIPSPPPSQTLQICQCSEPVENRISLPTK